MMCRPETKVTISYVGITIFALTLANASCGPRNYYVEHLEIDSTLHIRPIGLRMINEPTQGPYYFFFMQNT